MVPEIAAPLTSSKLQSKPQSKPRLEYIDLAKGICILLVISYHADMERAIYTDQPLSEFFFSFRMPLYYLLSGLFLSVKNNDYGLFVEKKFNRLLVPLIFFVLISNGYAFARKWAFGVDCVYNSPLWFIFTENRTGFNNNPLWFLFSLFTTYMLYVGLHYLTKGRLWPTIAGTIVCGIIGYMCGINHIYLPMYLDTSLTCLPFVSAGILIRQKTSILTRKDPRIQNAVIGIVLLVITFLLADGKNLFWINEYSCSIWRLYLGGISGSLGIIFLSKAIGYIPGINYIGRYSIILLGMHMLYLNLIGNFVSKVCSTDLEQSLMVIAIVLVMSFPTIMILKKFFPKFVAQADLLSFHKRA